MRRLIDEVRIREAVVDLGRRVADDYAGRPLTILGVLTGSIILVSDLVRQIALPHRIGVIQASSYRGRSTNAGDLVLHLDRLPDLDGRDVLLVDDIFDTGRTLDALCDALRQRDPGSVRVAVLLWKQGRSQVDWTPDYHCLQIPDEFVVGYGLDYNDEYRHLPYIAALDPEDL